MINTQSNGSYPPLLSTKKPLRKTLVRLRGGINKKTGVFYFFPKGGLGGLSQSIIRKKGFVRKAVIFWHILPKKGGFIKKNWKFFDHFSPKGGRDRNNGKT